jgi:hypothetical protein
MRYKEGVLNMKKSLNMRALLEYGFTFVTTMDEVIDLQEESILESILIDYFSVIFANHPDYRYKVYQCGGF